MALARSLARRFDRRGVPYDELLQVAYLALMGAADRFDEERGFRFTTFATPTIEGELKRHFRDRTWDMRVSRRVQDLHVALHHVVDPLTNRLGRSPTIGELAEAVGTSDEEVLEALEAGNVHSVASLHETPADGRGDDGAHPWLSVADDRLEDIEHRLLVQGLLTRLPPREQLIVRLRYYDNLSQEAIAARLGISQVHVSRLLGRSLDRLRAEAGEV